MSIRQSHWENARKESKFVDALWGGIRVPYNKTHHNRIASAQVDFWGEISFFILVALIKIMIFTYLTNALRQVSVSNYGTLYQHTVFESF